MQKIIFRIKAFFYVFYKSLTSTQYYKELLDTKGSFTLKYYVSLSLIATLIITLATVYRTAPIIDKFVMDLGSQAKQMYPQDLIFTVENSNWSINKPEPLIIPFPKIFGNMDPESLDMPINLIVFDKQGTIDDLEKYNTFILVNSKNIIARDTDKAVKSQPLGEMGNGKLTKTDFDSFVDMGLNIKKYIPYVFLTLMFLGMCFYFFALRPVYLLFVAGILLLIAYITKVSLNFSKAYRIALHAMTLPIVIQVIISVLNVRMAWSYWFFALNLLAGVFVLISLAKTQGHAPVPETPLNTN